MNEFSISAFRNLLKTIDFAIIGTRVKESLTYLPYGLAVRNRLYNLAMEELNDLGFNQILLTDLVDQQEVRKIDLISPISNNYFAIADSGLFMAASHDVPFYLFVKDLLKDNSRQIKFPLKYFHFGSGYRWSKNAKFPFNLGERKSFLECYGIYPSSEEALEGLQIGIEWNRKVIKDLLKIPSVEVERPLITNKKFSKKTICIDTLTPLGMTVITGMTYFQDDLYSKVLNVCYKGPLDSESKHVFATHFGLSENILFSFLINSYRPTGLRLLNILAPIQVSIIDTSSQSENNSAQLNTIVDHLKSQNIRYHINKFNGRNLNYELSLNRKRGIPLTIILGRNPDYPGEIIVLFDHVEEKMDIESLLEKIPYYLAKNDELIIKDFKKSEEEGIIYCTNMIQIKETVLNGKVAMFYLNHSDLKIIELESKISGAEILGFKQVEFFGKDIIDGEETKNVAYVSKRA